MTAGLKIGDRLLNTNQIINALIQYKLMDSLIGQVLLDEAIQTIELVPEAIWQWLMGSTAAVLPSDFETAIAHWCDTQGITPAYFQAVMLREWRVEQFKQHYFADQLESEFLRTKAWFDLVVYSVIQVDSLTLAQELYYQVRDDGVSFTAIAAEWLAPESDSTTCVGPIPLATVPPPLRPHLQADQVGIVQKPVLAGDRYWVVRLDQFIAARLTAATRRDLTNRLFDHWLQAKVNDLRTMPDAITVRSEES